jgi:hypothetical protein
MIETLRIERLQGESLSLFFETLYSWTTAFVSLLSLNFSDFLIRFAFPN